MIFTKYELDWTRICDNHHHEIIAVLTGLSFEEITIASPKSNRWHGRDYVQAFHKLGFNTSDRFIKFDANTDKPCMLRAVEIEKEREGWYSWAYHDNWIVEQGECYTLKMWKEYYPQLKITSMLQVWI